MSLLWALKMVTVHRSRRNVGPGIEQLNGRRGINLARGESRPLGHGPENLTGRGRQGGAVCPILGFGPGGG